MSEEIKTSLYRRSTIGSELYSTLEELEDDGKISLELRENVMSKFDERIVKYLKENVKSNISFKVIIYLFIKKIKGKSTYVSLS
jgi:hypothetical protein